MCKVVVVLGEQMMLLSCACQSEELVGGQIVGFCSVSWFVHCDVVVFGG